MLSAYCWAEMNTGAVRTWVLQHECDDDRAIDPHWWSIRLQHSCSATVISAVGVTQAITGESMKAIRIHVAATWRKTRIKKQFTV